MANWISDIGISISIGYPILNYENIRYWYQVRISYRHSPGSGDRMWNDLTFRITPPYTEKNISLIRQQVDYSSVVWAPHTEADICHIERVQCRAARCACNRYRNTRVV